MPIPVAREAAREKIEKKLKKWQQTFLKYNHVLKRLSILTQIQSMWSLQTTRMALRKYDKVY